MIGTNTRIKRALHPTWCREARSMNQELKVTKYELIRTYETGGDKEYERRMMKYEHTNNEYVRLPRTLRGAGEYTNDEETINYKKKKL